VKFESRLFRQYKTLSEKSESVFCFWWENKNSTKFKIQQKAAHENNTVQERAGS
jgi:hypothetical protein